MRLNLFVIVAVVLQSWQVFAIDAISENTRMTCEEIQLKKTLKVYKDPALYPSSPGLIDVDPATGLEMSHAENPLLSTFTGVFHMKRMGPPRQFREFRTIAQVYDLDAKAKSNNRYHLPTKTELDNLAVQIQLCGDSDPYAGTFGFVFLKDLQQAQIDDEQHGQLPPSVYPNPIPRLPTAN